MRVSLFFIIIAVMRTASVGQTAVLIQRPVILVGHPPVVMDHKFAFSVRLSGNPAIKRAGNLSVVCSDSLTCAPEQQSVNLSEPGIFPFTAVLVDNANSADIAVQLAVEGSETVGSSQALDFGLWKLVSKVGFSDPGDFEGGGESKIYLWLEDSTGKKILPSSTLQVEALSKDGCVTMKTVASNEDERSKLYSKNAASEIKAGTAEARDALWLHAGYWTRSQCTLDITLSSAGEIGNRYPIVLVVKPNYWPAFAVCILGAFCQYVLSALIKLVIAARAGEKVSPKALFIGAYCVEIIDTGLKGTLAFIIAYALDSTDIIKFKGVGNNSIKGFAVFAFLIGFWQIQPLWAAISRMAQGPTEPKGQEKGLHTDSTLETNKKSGAA